MDVEEAVDYENISIGVFLRAINSDYIPRDLTDEQEGMTILNLARIVPPQPKGETIGEILISRDRDTWLAVKSAGWEHDHEQIISLERK